MKDPIVEEVRKFRMEHTLKFGGNLVAIGADLRHIENSSGHKVICLTPKKSDIPAKSLIDCETINLSG